MGSRCSPASVAWFERGGADAFLACTDGGDDARRVPLPDRESGRTDAARRAAAGPVGKGRDDDASAEVFLEQAKQAIAAGRISAAQEALERAETRALARSVRPSQAREPSQQSFVQKLSQARQALAAGDRKLALQRIDEAAATAEPN